MAYTGKVFPFKHNWANPVLESLEWLTDVLPKRSGLEQRIRLRAVPRRTLEYSVITGGRGWEDQRRRFDAFVYVNQDQEFVVPIWTDAERAGSNLLVDRLFTSVTGKNYDNNGYVIVWRSYKDYEVVKVDEVSLELGRVRFEEDLVGPLTGIVAPARLCKFNPETNGVAYSTDFNSAVVQFEQVIPSIPPANQYRYIEPVVAQYRSTDTWAKNGNDGNVERNFIRKLSRLDFQTGPVVYDSIQPAPTLTHGHNRLASGRAEVAELLGWLHKRQGRLKPFWVPSFERDFKVAATAASGQPIFTCESFGYTENYLDRPGRQDIVIVRPSGHEYHRIIDATDDGTTETITLDANLASTLNTIDRVSFARFCRIDHDRIELAWHMNGTIQVQMKLRELFITT